MHALLPPGSLRIADSVQDLVALCDIIFTCLSYNDAVKEVFELALSDKLYGKLFVMCSTIHHLETKALSERILQAGTRFVACRVCQKDDHNHTFLEAYRYFTVFGAPTVQTVANWCASLPDRTLTCKTCFYIAKASWPEQ
jgi:hypothetical protein